MCVCALKDTSNENICLNAFKEFVAKKDIMFYHFVDLPLRLKVFTSLCKSEVHILPYVSGSGNLAISKGFVNFFIL